MRRNSDTLVLLAFPCILAFFALWFAVPRLISALTVLPSHAALEAVSKGEAVSEGAAKNAIAARKTAAGWVADPKLHAEIGSLHLVQAGKAGYASAEGIQFLKASIAAERRSLTLSPAQPYAWVQLLQARLALEGPSKDLSPLFAMSVETAPTEPRLVMRRLAIGLAIWVHLDPQATEQLRSQILIAAHHAPTRLAELAKKRYALKLVYDSLADEPELRQRLIQSYQGL
ncbi:MAG: hypothetical protein J4G10_00270 [Alphaproteobacteria bacterium]|nr:hypothetical protein [Alphaproteobacteria bacterium]